jgi:signal recognition particle subunit SRP72
MGDPIHVQYTKIQEAVNSESWETVISISDKILKSTPNDKDALACKISALIKNDQLSDAMKEINNSVDKDHYNFERAYILYKEKKPEALQLLADSPKEEKYFVLRAQVSFYFFLAYFLSNLY